MLPLPSDTDLPPASVTEIASILANGYARYRASLRRSPQGQPDGAQAQPPTPALLSRPHRAFMSVWLTPKERVRREERESNDERFCLEGD